MSKIPSKPKPIARSPRADAPTVSITVASPPERGTEHPEQNLDRRVGTVSARLTGGISTHALIETWTNWACHFSQSPMQQLKLLEHAQRSALKLMTSAIDARGQAAPSFTPKSYDHRFDDPAWQNAPFNMFEQGFLAMQDWWDLATDQSSGLQPEDANRTRFLARQTFDLISPSSFPWLNPEIIFETAGTGGGSLRAGAANFAHDFLKMVSQTQDAPPIGYEIGTGLACTPGHVVFRNDLFELIQYESQTGKVQAEPILFVPAWIMKYYVLDLSPRNSMVNYLVGQGFTVFMISWCNPTADQADLSLEDYRRRGVMAALAAINTILPKRRVHAVGYCLGGTILAIAAATMARDGDMGLASITLLAAQVDFAQAGELTLFLDERQVALFEDIMWDQGYLDWPQMARAFFTVRSEDLIYSRAVRRYFLGKEDLPSDMSVWMADTTRLPARMHSQYLRELFLENRLTAGRFEAGDRVIALKDISAPLFVVATEADHVAPWKSVYKTQLFTDCDLRFVLTSGGHNDGIVNEPGSPHRHFRVSQRSKGATYVGPDAWFAQHAPQSGSWWPVWKEWLDDKSSGLVSSADIGATGRHRLPIILAPGTYVHQT